MRNFILILVLLSSNLLLAQSQFPIQVNLLWDMNPDTDEVTHYTIAMDTTFSAQLPTSSCALATRTCAQPITVPDNQNHTINLRAVNNWGVSDPYTLTFRINNPSKPNNIRIQK